MSTLAHRKSHGDERQLNRSESFSKSKRPKKSGLGSMIRKVTVGATLLALVCVLGYICGEDAASGGSVRRHLSSLRHDAREAPTTPTMNLDLPWDSPFYKLSEEAKNGEKEILAFFNDDKRALENGVPIGGTEDSTPRLSQRLARKINLCKREGAKEEDCVLRVAFIGGAQTSGHDVFYNDTFPFIAEQRLLPIAEAAGLKLEVMNHAQDSDTSKEGPQTMHLCVANFVGESVDVIGWDLDQSMQGTPPAQFEAFVRWAFASDPAMIMINRGGPHARSRRGFPRFLFNFQKDHDANIFEEDPDSVPKLREEPYVGSIEWNARWEEGRNAFFKEIIDQYSSSIDFAAVDPSGSIWTLDHLPEFSNAAMEADKALPFLDCGEDHPAPCDHVPPFIANKLTIKNISLDDFSSEQIGGGALCAGLFGCRNIKYGGKRSHQLRGELNALPIVRSFLYASAMLDSKTEISQPAGQNDSQDIVTSQSRALSLKSLPPPKHCAEAFCNKVPKCMTSYLPNLGLSLSSAITSNNGTLPRMGAAHFAHNPEFAVENLEKRFAPLGYIDRKHAYRITAPTPQKIMVDGNFTGEYEPLDTPTADISFIMDGTGPVVLCEPPCFLNKCSSFRRMPLIPHVTLELDGQKLEITPELPHAVEANGPFCRTVANDVPPGEHILRVTAITKAPHYAMFSHLITFS